MNNDERNKDSEEQRMKFVLRRYKADALDADRAWAQFGKQHAIRRSLPLRRYLMATAAVMLLLIGFGSLYLIQQSKPQWVIITADNGKLKNIYLPDSSLITLSGNSELRYDNKQYGKERRAVLLKGKAYFAVSRDESRPFSVQTEATKTVVLGTSFQLIEENDTTSLYVESGKVSFSGESGELLLTAGMSAKYVGESGAISLDEEEESPNILAWKTGELVFNETPLGTVIRELTEYYQVQIVSPEPLNSDLKLTATFIRLPLDEALFIINQTLETSLTASY